MGKLTILNQHGDEVLTWDRELVEAVNGIVTVEEAEKAFNKMVKDKDGPKYLAYKHDGNGSNAEKIKDFDPTAEEITLSPQMQGG